MKIVGIDLAGNPGNDTGFCIMNVTGDEKNVHASILHADDEIIEKVKEADPALIAIDAPLTYCGENRACDEELHKYGALPVTLRGMVVLAERGSMLAEKLRELDLEVIEVFSTATAKILGHYDKRDKVMQKKLINSGIKGDVDRRFLTRDELDAVFASITAFLHLNRLTYAVGDEKGKIITPKV
ncbi:MAG: DUF429 domain-containing protein [Candidatus Altiarchaeales archaeon]|nr:DUF429 domain-containing protein [Candidatus Altiarchaeales archaeon]